MTNNPKTKQFKVKNVPIGRGQFTVIAGPCAVEDDEILLQIAREAKDSGVSILRGGAFKPRTSPESFQGLGKEGLKMLGQVKKEVDIPVITEVMDPRHIEWVAEVADIFQIGSRNMHSYSLLKEIGKAGKPVMLKRGMAATEKEFLSAAEYISQGGEERIILCERGVRGVNEMTRNMLDLGLVPTLQARSSYPVFVDPSHATGRSDLVGPMSKAAVAAGADGVMIEVHPTPQTAKCDGEQALPLNQLQGLMEQLRKYSELEGKSMTGAKMEVF